MKKLTLTQENVLKDIRDKVTHAKSTTFYRWLGEVVSLDWWNVGKKYPSRSEEERSSLVIHQKEQLDALMENPDRHKFWTGCYDRVRESQETVCHAPSGTLRALERMGLITIVADSANARGYGIDRVRLTEEIPVTSDRR